MARLFATLAVFAIGPSTVLAQSDRPVEIPLKDIWCLTNRKPATFTSLSPK